jgi:hypothetical protein
LFRVAGSKKLFIEINRSIPAKFYHTNLSQQHVTIQAEGKIALGWKVDVTLETFKLALGKHLLYFILIC